MVDYHSELDQIGIVIILGSPLSNQQSEGN